MMKVIYVFILTCFTFYNISAQDNYKRIQITPDFEVVKISDDAYVHITYTETTEFGRIPSNGLIFINNGKAFLFDTPMTEELTKTLVAWIQDTMGIKIVGFVPNHWHSDCIGGLAFLKSIGIESYANEKTIQITKSKNLAVPEKGFKDSLHLNLDDKDIICSYFGAGHTSDNIVVWIPSEKILFGGCMVKEFNTNSLGNIADANLKQWPKTIQAVLDKYGNAYIVIPGHGPFGGIELLKHTKELLTKHNLEAN